MSDVTPSPLARLFKTLTAVEPVEIKAVLMSFLYCFFIFVSYFIVRPLRDTMGTVYGVAHLQELFTGTFIASFIVAPVYAGFASRIRLATFLPWVYGFIALTMIGFYFAFQADANNRWLAAAFYVWVSTFNLLTISVFWSMMADIFSRTQAKRLFGFIAAGGTIGTIAAPAFTVLFVGAVGTNNLLLISAAGFVADGLSGPGGGSAKSATSPRTIPRRRRPAWTTSWAAIHLTASCCCSSRLIC